MKSFFKKFIGDKSFYKRVLAISLPIMLQNALANFVNTLDNLMVGALGTESMSGVSIANRFIFIFNLLIFGVMAAGGVFTAQYHGAKNEEGVKNTFKLKLLLGLLLSSLAIVLFLALDDELITAFLHESTDESISLEQTLAHAKTYLHIYLIGIIPYVIDQAYASTSRETGNTVVPMYSAFISIGTNFIFNALLIFGICGFPALGVAGAAIATVISRFAAFIYNAVVMHVKSGDFYFTRGVYKSFRIPSKLLYGIAVKGLPIIFNECLWSMAVTMQNQAFSVRGIDVVAAFNISENLVFLLSVVYMSLNSAIAIIVGAELGAGEIEKGRDTSYKMMAFSFASAVALCLFMIALSPIFPHLYDTTDGVRHLATELIIIAAIFSPIASLSHSMYFVLRTGGAVFSTAAMDSGFMWVIAVPAANLLVHFTPFNIITIYALARLLEVLKVAFGGFLISRGTWSKQLVKPDDSPIAE